MRRPSLSIFSRLLLAFGEVVIVISGLLMLVFYVTTVRFEQARVKERLLQQLGAIERSFYYQFQDALIRDLRVLVANPLLDDFIMSSELEKQILSKAVERLFLQALTHTKSYESVTYVNVLGKETVKVNRAGRVRAYQDLKDSALFQRLKAGAPGSMRTEGPTKTGVGSVSFAIGVHKVDGDIGKFGGAVVVEYRLDTFLEYLDTVRIFGEDPVWVFGPQGEILKRPLTASAVLDPHATLPQGAIWQPTLSRVRDGLIAAQDLSILPGEPFLRMVVSIPSAILLRDIRETLRFSLVVFVAAVLGTFLIAFGLSRHLSRPIVELAAAAGRMAKGDLSGRVTVQTTGEVAMLIYSFNHMAQDLQRLMEAEKKLATIAAAAATAERERAAELARSNQELGQFAYIASHDLQEPLRVVASFSQLLARRYQGQLGTEADEFIAFIGNGVARMQGLINDLLEYSRVGTRGKPFEPTPCDALVEQVLSNLKVAITEVNATVTYDGLPTVQADATQLGRVFQNLIANALKFHHKDAPPQVQISAARQDRYWRFAVRDNGIGIDPAYHERIFVLFQRLHTSAEYPGTGIGLAICKKIVERHGGRIWVESAPGHGATFSFTIPAGDHGRPA